MMQPIPADYNPYPDVRWSDFRITFRMIDTGAADDAAPGATGTDAEITRLPQVIDGVSEMSGPWATWETDGFPMDGSVKLLPSDLSAHQFGWWSVISGADGVFSPVPVLSFDFASNHSVVGLTIHFDDATPQYPAEIKITYRDYAGAVIAEAIDAVNAPMHVFDLPAADFRRIEIAVLKTHKPYQSARICEVIFGVINRFDCDNAVNMSLIGAVSPAAESLESTTLSVVFDNVDHRYNLANPAGIYAYLQDGQVLDVEIGVGPARADIDYFNCGRLFFTAARADDNAMTAKIIANDPFYALSGSVCNIGTTGTWTLSAAIAAIVADSGQDISYTIPPGYASRVIRRCIPQGIDHREAIRLAAQAAKCTCWFDRENTLVFGEILPGEPTETISGEIMPAHPQATVAERINAVIVTARDEYADGNDTEYTANNVSPGESVRVWTVDNPLVNDPTVAAWILSIKQRRVTYIVNGERGNPARELGDTVTVRDVYGNVIPSIQTRSELIQNGALSANGTYWGYV